MNGNSAPPRRSQAISSFHDIAVQQARSLQNEKDVTALNQTMKSIGILLNYLTTYGDQMMVQGVTVRKFERLTLEQIPKLADDSVLHRILRTSGWVGSRYQFSAQCPVDVAPMKQMLATLYLSRAVGVGQTIENEDDDDDVIKSFCPDILVRCALNGTLESLFPQKGPAAEGVLAVAAAATKAARDTSDGRLSLLLPHELMGSGQKSVPFFGSCMLVDISGFTKLSAALCTRDSAGLDDLHLAISGYLGRCVEIVYAYGGDVISFAGDALICVFSQPNGWKKDQDGTAAGACFEGSGNVPSSEVATDFSDSRSAGFSNDSKECIPPNALAAVRCAMELKEHCTDTLTAHIAVSCGEMSFVMLGGHRKEYIYMLVGGCINELSTCIDDAKSKQVVVTPSVAEWLTKELQIHHEYKDRESNVSTTVMESTGNVRVDSISGAAVRPPDINRLDTITSDEAVMEKLQRFTPPTVLDSLSTNSFQVSSQLREVTTMFLKLDTFDASAMAESVPLLQSFFFGAQEILAECGGFMRQFLVDDKGCVLIAMWGVPSFTHANNCSRALHAAGKLAQLTRTLRHRCSIGITTGQVFCGTVGSVTRRDYVGIGSKVNMSARLMGKAKGRIVIDRDTHSRLPLGARHLLREIEPLKLKGLEEPVTAYECTNAITEPASFAVDEEDDEPGQVVRLQKNIVKALRVQLNALVASSTASVGDPCGGSTEGSDLGRKNKTWYSGKFGRADSGGLVMLDSDSKSTVNSGLASIVAPVKNAENVKRTALTRDNSASASCSHANVAKLNSTSQREKHSPEGIRLDMRPDVSFSAIRGPAGSGKTSSTDYVRRGARSRGLRCVYVRARSGDEHNAYGVIGKVLVELIGPDELNSERRQKATLKRLVQLIFPQQNPIAVLSRSKAIRSALGYKWLDVTETTVLPLNGAHSGRSEVSGGEANSNRDSTSNVSKLSGGAGIMSKLASFDFEVSAGRLPLKQIFGASSSPLNNNPALTSEVLAKFRQTHSANPSINGSFSENTSRVNYTAIHAPTATTVTSAQHDPSSPSIRSKQTINEDEVLTQLLLLLLQHTPTVVVIDDAHNADELSWVEIRNIIDMPVQTAVVLTLLSRPSVEIAASRFGADFAPASALESTSEMLQVPALASSSYLARPAGATALRVPTNMRHASNASVVAILEHTCCVSLDMLPLGYAEVHHLLVDVLQQENRRTHALNTKSNASFRRSANFSDFAAVDPTVPAAAASLNNSASYDGNPDEPSGTGASFSLGAIFHAPAAGKIPGMKSQRKGTQQLTQLVAPPVTAPATVHVTPELIESVHRVSNGNAFWCRAIADFIVERGVNDFMRHIDQANDNLDEDLSLTPRGPGSRASSGEIDSSFRMSSGSGNASPRQLTRLNSSTGHSPHPSAASTYSRRRKRVCNPLDVLVVCRLEKLPHHLQVVIKHAAIIGHEFSFNTLRAVLPAENVSKLQRSMEMLLESSFILCIGSIDKISESYCFQNYLMRNAIYDLMPPSEASKIHELVAEHIEHTSSVECTQQLGSLYYHYSMAPNRQKEAFRYATLTADDCVSRNAINDALYFVQRAALLANAYEDSSPIDYRLVLAVVNNALELIRPAGFMAFIMSRLTDSRDKKIAAKGLASRLKQLSVRSKYDSEVLMPAYKQVKVRMENKIRQNLLPSPVVSEFSGKMFSKNGSLSRIKSESVIATMRIVEEEFRGSCFSFGCCYTHGGAVVVPSPQNL